MTERNILWRIYFWLSAFSLFGSFVFQLQSRQLKQSPDFLWLPTFKATDWLVFVFSILLVVGLYIFVYGKESPFSAKFWKVVFWVLVIFTIWEIIYLLIPSEINLPVFLESIEIDLRNNPAFSYSVSGAIVSYLFAIPAYYAIYWLAYRKER